MKYQMEIIQEFEGRINGVKINDKRRYYSIGFILDCLIERDIKFNETMIHELDSIIGYVLTKGYITLGEFEQDVYYAIDENHLFPEDYFGRGLFEDANKLIKEFND